MSLYHLYSGNVSDVYCEWPRPDLIISDGAYGVRGFRGDTIDASGIADWYAPHIAEWSKAAKPSTSLFFWNREIGWANVHPLLEANGWEFVQLVTWDKGISHVAGNVNSKTIRQFPIVSEISALYRRRLYLPTDIGTLPVKQWLRHEWQRSGLPLSKSNEACGVKNAASRKYLTQDWLWYWPPGEAIEAMSRYATLHGNATERPYFSIDGISEITAKKWDELRATWHHQNGLTNVWSRQPLHDSERIKGTLERSAPRTYKPTKASSAHLNQKPLDLTIRQVFAASNPGDIVWEPFGGLATASVASVLMGRVPYAAEVDAAFAKLALQRLETAAGYVREHGTMEGDQDGEAPTL